MQIARSQNEIERMWLSFIGLHRPLCQPSPGTAPPEFGTPRFPDFGSRSTATEYSTARLLIGRRDSRPPSAATPAAICLPVRAGWQVRASQLPDRVIDLSLFLTW